MNILSSLLNWIGTQIGADPSTLTTTSKTLVGSINEINSHAVVEQGTSGNWTYRKWSDGTAECWGTHSFNTGAFSAWGSWYTGATRWNATYPTGLFIEAPTYSIVPWSATSVTIITAGGQASEAPSKDHTGNYIATRAASSSAGNVKVYVYAIGKWK